MPVSQLFAGDLDAYFRDEADRPGTLWVFQHIPKTAGSSFRQELASRLRPDANIHADHSNLQRPILETLNEALDVFLRDLPGQGYRFASGHLRHREMQRLVAARPDARLVTMLRDPVARTVSDYRYMRTPAHPSRQEVIERFPRFEDYLADRTSHDKMFRCLRSSPHDSVNDVIDHLERRFSFVGTQEFYDFSCRVLFRLLGRDAQPQVFTRRTESLAENEIPNLSQLVSRARECNQADIAIHDHFAERFKRLAPLLHDYLAVPSPARRRRLPSELI